MIIKMKPRISLEELIQRIESAGCEEMGAIADAQESRYKCLYPDWEVVFLSVPTGNSENQSEQARLMIEFIQNHWLNA